MLSSLRQPTYQEEEEEESHSCCLFTAWCKYLHRTHKNIWKHLKCKDAGSKEKSLSMAGTFSSHEWDHRESSGQMRNTLWSRGWTLYLQIETAMTAAPLRLFHAEWKWIRSKGAFGLHPPTVSFAFWWLPTHLTQTLPKSSDLQSIILRTRFTT